MDKLDKWAMLLIGLVAGWVISTAPSMVDALSHDDWLDIATAAGTVLAAVATFTAAGIALWFGLADSRRREAERRGRARLIASGLAIKMALAGARISSARSCFNYKDDEFPGASQAAETVLAHIQYVASSVSDDEIFGIEPVLNATAQSLSEARALAGAIVQLVEHLLPKLEGLELAMDQQHTSVESFVSLRKHVDELSGMWLSSLDALKEAYPST